MSGSHAIKVLVRCRPLSEAESKGRHPTVVTCNSRERQVTVHSEVRGQDTKKTYTFDSVFGEFSQQESVFEDISGIIDEVLEGFNCTVFAYGQTGTGKTYTMQGPVLNGYRNVDCGIIPRSINAIFDRLQAKDVNECVVHVSCLEIYNEEILDLLSDSNETDLRIFDDVVKGVFVSNLEEVPVVDPTDIFTVLNRCWDRRKTAETKMNAASSRSHTIFTVKVHTKETTVDGESIIKIGKLNLVDLAGSECVGKSEAVGQRAKEAGNINRSLLTLGRVINALVQGQRHIPYRESKLTRLLQESLGGRAKTILIATISPSQRALEETLKTLEYAHTAKNILNRPEVNQKVTQKAFVRDLQLNMSLIKKQLEAQRAKAGVYLPNDQYEAMEAELAAGRASLERHTDQIDALRQELHQITDSNERLRQDQAALKEAHAAQVQGLHDDLERARTAWRADLDRLGHQVRTLTDERDAARDAVARRDRALLAQAEAVADCQTACAGHVVDVRKSLDDFLALQSNRTKIAVDQARAWAGTLGQSARALHDGLGRMAGDLGHDLQIVFAYLHSVTNAGDGVLSVNVGEIRDQIQGMRDRLAAFQAAAGAACDGRRHQLQADLDAFRHDLEQRLESDHDQIASLIDTMRHQTDAMTQAWIALDRDVIARHAQHAAALGQYRTALIESFIDQERAVRAECDTLAQALVEMVRARAGALVDQMGQRAADADARIEALSADLAASFDDWRAQLTTTIGAATEACRDQDRGLVQVRERVQGTAHDLAQSVTAIPTSCDAIGAVVSAFVDDNGPGLDRIGSCAAQMATPIQTIRESSASHQAGAETRLQDLRQALGRYVAETGQQCKDQVASVVDAQQQFESELKYRELHHQAVGEIGARIQALAQHPPYTSPIRAKSAPSSSPSSKAPVPSSRLKRPRPLSREFDDVENERPPLNA